MYLEKLKTSNDLKQFNIDELCALAQEIREEIIKDVNGNGGHLSANLGIVETTIAVYYVFDLPTDKLLFDVGHQCYTHKILSGRLDKMSTLRTEDGISGFTNPVESEYDSFISGHAGNSIATGIGMCKARDLLGEDYFVLDIVGDASLLNGLSLEAITSSDEKPKKFIVILNDNGMSISKNNNGFYKSILKHTTKPSYIKFKGNTKKLLKKTFIGRILKKIKDFFKRVFDPHIYIDNAGLKYVGTIDGHNLKELITTFTRVKQMERPTLVHVSTVKGKGYKEAELHPDIYHAVGKNMQTSCNTFSESVSGIMVTLAKENEKITAITAGTKAGVGLTDFANEFPSRFIDTGISEGYAVTMAAGMAKAGLRPFVFIYSTFLQRSYDEIIHDVCIQNLPVVFCLDRAGVVGSDGVTHQGVFDLSYLRHIPNMTVLAPKDTVELESALKYAVSLNSPVAVRYPNGEYVPYENHTEFDGKWEKLEEGTTVTVLAEGNRMINLALSLKEENISATVYNARSVKPLDVSVLDGLKGLVITLEDNSVLGGFGSSVNEYVNEQGLNVTVKNYGIKDEFVKHATVSRQLEVNGLTKEILATKIKEELCKGK